MIHAALIPIGLYTDIWHVHAAANTLQDIYIVSERDPGAVV